MLNQTMTQTRELHLLQLFGMLCFHIHLFGSTSRI